MTSLPNETACNASFEFTALQLVQNYRRALLAEFSPHLRGRVLEVGSGIGQFTEQLASVTTVEGVLAVEPDGSFCRQLRQRLPAQAVIQGTVGSLRQDSSWNAVVSVNVLEHIEDDAAELKRYRALLAGCHGVLCLFVPARREIYAPLDKDFGHYRRYARAELTAKLRAAGFEIVRLNYFNLIGYFGWWFSFVLMKKRCFDRRAVVLFDRCVLPWSHWLESHLVRPPLGQSLIAVARA